MEMLSKWWLIFIERTSLGVPICWFPFEVPKYVIYLKRTDGHDFSLWTWGPGWARLLEACNKAKCGHAVQATTAGEETLDGDTLSVHPGCSFLSSRTVRPAVWFDRPGFQRSGFPTDWLKGKTNSVLCQEKQKSLHVWGNTLGCKPGLRSLCFLYNLLH